MGAAHAPVASNGEVILEVEQEVIRGHGAALEEVARNPVRRVLALEVVGEFTVGEDVNEELPAWAQPAGDFCHEELVVLHVLEHLDGNHTVERGVTGFEFIHIRSQDAHIFESPPRRFGVDVGFLGGGVGNACDAGVRVFFRHPEGEASPAAAEFQHILSIAELGSLAAEGQHGLLGFGKSRILARPVAGAVFHAGTEDEFEEVGRHLVVLFIRRLGLDGNRAALEFFDECAQGLALRDGVGLSLLAEFFGKQVANADANGGVWQEISGEKVVDGDHGFLGIQGMNGLVRRW